MSRTRRLVLLVVASLALAGCAGGSSTPGTHASTPPVSSESPSPQPSPRSYTSPPAQLPVGTIELSTADPPWPPPAIIDGGADSLDYVKAAGLPYGEEVTTVHYHAHLDIDVDGEKVTVPPYLGFVTNGSKSLGLAPLHTHDDSGIIHIENDVPATFNLGQVFIEWGVKFTPNCLGPFCTGGGKELAVFVNGTRYTGDPTKLVLKKHQEIAVEYGGSGTLPTPPSSYDFPGDL